MADLFVDNAGSNTSPYDTWAKAANLLATATAACAAGDTIYVASTHTESSSVAQTFAPTSTAAAPTKILCVTKNGTAGNTGLATGASVAVTGTGDLNFSAKHVYVYGIDFKCCEDGTNTTSAQTTFNASADSKWIFEQCLFKNNSPATGVFTAIDFGSKDSSGRGDALELIDSDIQFAGTHAAMAINSLDFTWRGGAVVGNTPVSWLKGGPNPGGKALIRGVDFSSITGGTNAIVDLSATCRTDFTFLDCKLASDTVLKTGTITSPGAMAATFINCDSGDPSTVIKKSLYRYAGDIVQSTAITKDGTEGDVAAYTMKMTANASASRIYPLSLDFEVWNETVGSSVDVSVDVLADDGATLTDADVWLDIEYLGTAGSTLASFADDGAADILTSGTNRTGTADPTDWNGITVGAKKYTLSVTVTPNEKGLIRATVNLAKASQVLYVDPKLSVA